MSCHQISINGTLTLPSQKPAVEAIIRVTTTPVVDKTIILRKKVIFFGHVFIGIEYAAQVPAGTQPIHFVSFRIPFSGVKHHCRARQHLTARLKFKVIFQKFQIIDPRTIKKIISLKLCRLKLSHWKPAPPIAAPDRLYSLVSQPAAGEQSAADPLNSQPLTADLSGLHPSPDDNYQPQAGSYKSKPAAAAGNPGTQPAAVNDSNRQYDPSASNFSPGTDYYLPVSIHPYTTNRQ